MDRHEALAALSSESWHERLKAARSLGATATEEDLSVLQTALAGETVSYVRKFLDSAVRRVRRDIDEARAGHAENVPPSLMRQVYARAVEEVTRTVLHEVEAIAGAIALAASREIDPYEGSRTEAQINRLNKQLEAITHLKAAAAAPRISKFALGTWIKALVDEEGLGDLAFHVSTAPGEALIRKCQSNLAAGQRPVIVTAGRGVGLAAGLAENAAIGDRLDVFDVEQWLAADIIERAGDSAGGRLAALEALLDRYNRIVAAVETDPSLRIELAASGRA